MPRQLTDHRRGTHTSQVLKLPSSIAQLAQHDSGAESWFANCTRAALRHAGASGASAEDRRAQAMMSSGFHPVLLDK